MENTQMDHDENKLKEIQSIYYFNLFLYTEKLNKINKPANVITAKVK